MSTVKLFSSKSFSKRALHSVLERVAVSRVELFILSFLEVNAPQIFFSIQAERLSDLNSIIPLKQPVAFKNWNWPAFSKRGLAARSMRNKTFILTCGTDLTVDVNDFKTGVDVRSNNEQKFPDQTGVRQESDSCHL